MKAGRWIVLAALLALNGVAGWMGLRGYAAFASRNWREVPGHVVASTVTPVPGTSTWLADIEYRVRGRRRSATRLGADLRRAPRRPRHASQASAERVARSYPVGRAVIVYVDPAAPDHAVLERAGAFRLVGVGTLMVTVAVVSDLLAVAFVVSRRRAPGHDAG